MDTQPQMRTERYDPRAERPTDGPASTGDQASGRRNQGLAQTTEFWIYLAAVAGVLIASYGVGVNANHSDYFRADKAWWFIVLLTIEYPVSRGLAKAGRT